jgi:hypothetical protein
MFIQYLFWRRESSGGIVMGRGKRVLSFTQLHFQFIRRDISTGVKRGET